MGAKNKDIEEIVVTEEQVAFYQECLDTVADLVDEAKKVGAPIREFALALTKLEECEMWVDRGMESLGIPPDDSDDEDDEDDDGDSKKKGEEE